jgi:hypothetical protein
MPDSHQIPLLHRYDNAAHIAPLDRVAGMIRQEAELELDTAAMATRKPHASGTPRPAD